MTDNATVNALLRPAILQILRAVGYHSARPSAIDTLVDLAARYLMLLANRTAYHSFAVDDNDGEDLVIAEPNLSHVRMAMTDCCVFAPTSTSTEEAWRERFRQPLETYPTANARRSKERQKRDLEDTRDVREFMAWFKSDINREIMRVSGMLDNANSVGQKAKEAASDVDGERLDYLTALIRKSSKSSVNNSNGNAGGANGNGNSENRFKDTILFQGSDDKPVKIEGGFAESLSQWHGYIRTQNLKRFNNSSTTPK